MIPHPPTSARPTRTILLIPALLLLLGAVAANAQVRRDDLLAPAPAPGAVGADSPVAAADLAQRLERLERMLNEQSLSDFVVQLQQLQQEVQELRGQVEMHQYQLRRGGGSIQLGQSYAESQRAAEGAEAAGEGAAATPGAAPADPAAAQAAASAEGQAPTVPIAPPPQTGVGALGGGGDSGGTLALPSPETLAGGERDAYRRAFERLKERDYPAAKQEFAAMLVSYPQGQFADNGVYWLGEIGYVNKDYAAALTHFNRLISDYPGSPKVPSAMLKLGYIFYEQQNMDQARSMLEAVSERFPDTTEGRLARGRLEQMTREVGG